MILQSNLLKDKIVLITGCNRGIGRAILERFAQHGATVYAGARQENSLNHISLELTNKHHTSIIPTYFDVTNALAVKKVFQKIFKEQKKLDCIVNNAGIMQDALIGMATKTNLEETFAVNVFAPIDMIQYAAKLMKRQKSGSIINISSIVGRNGNAGQIVYSASKGAVIAMTKTAAKELAPFNIRVNNIAPGMIDTEMFRSIGEYRIQEKLSNIGMGRLGSPEEVADTAVFLASDMSVYVTGQTIGVDGSAII